MKKRFYTLLLTLPLVTMSAKASTKTVQHTIKKGETLYTIAHMNHTTISEVRELNGLKKGEMLKLGQVLTVPQDTYVLPKDAHLTPKEPVEYTIASGDTLYSVAHRYHTTIAEVQKLNGLKKGERLSIGRVLRVPRDTYIPQSESHSKHVKLAKKRVKKATKIALHTVKRGDTISEIAQKYHLSIAEVRTLNKMQKGQLIKVGEKLKVIAHAPAKVKRHRVASKSVKRIVKKSPTHAKKRIVRSTKRVKRPARYALDDLLFGHHSSSKGKKITRLAKKKLGKRYVWGAEGNNVFDCSGLTQYVCKKNGIKLPRRAIQQSKVGKRVSRKDLKTGDLVFFDTSRRRKGYVNHVGIYIGNNKFIHASSAKKKVVITSLSKNFYSQRFKGARRVAM